MPQLQLSQQIELSRVVTVIPTFFTSSLSVDYNSMLNHINMQINQGIQSIVILGTTSEAPTLSIDERLEIANIVHNNFKNKVNIIVGLGGNNTNEMVNELIQISPYADYIMISQPSYNKPSQEGIVQHFQRLINTANKPVIIYNIPSRCGVNMEPSTIQRIVQFSSNVIAIKEASGNIDQVMQVRELCPDLVIYSGDDALVLPILSVGGFGVISVVSNIIPNQMINLVNDFINGNHHTASTLFYKFRPLIKYCFIESNPTPVKYVLSAISGYDSLAYVRLPLVELSSESKNKYYDLAPIYNHQLL
jgi:4-hydroxy-tetrahydrodipicolinate synthase